MEHSAAGVAASAGGSPELNLFRASVVIPTLDRPEQLLACLQALSDDFPDGSEVIVVSDGGDLDRFPDLGKFQEALNLTVLNIEHGGPAHARNEGLRRVNSPIVVFLDDDCLPEPGWLKNMLSEVSVEPPVSVGGKTLNGLPDNLYSTASQLVLDLLERDQQERGYEPLFYPSNNLAFPTAALKKLNGFDAQFLTSEDRELCRRWLEAGHAMTTAPGAVIYHCPVLNFSHFWKKFTLYGEGAAQFHRSSVGEWQKNSLGFHFRVPALAAREMSAKGLRRRPALFFLMVVWELANLVGFTKGIWKNLGRQLTNRVPDRDVT